MPMGYKVLICCIQQDNHAYISVQVLASEEYKRAKTRRILQYLLSAVLVIQVTQLARSAASNTEILS